MSLKSVITYLALAAAAALGASLLGGCAVESILEQKHSGIEIAFRPATGAGAPTAAPHSRAAEVGLSNLKNRDLLVTAVDAHGDYYFKDIIFRNEDPTSSTPIYTSNEKYYWPGDGSPLHFTVYPADYRNGNRLIAPGPTPTIHYSPMSSWYAGEVNAFEGGHILPDGTTIAPNGAVRLPDGETVAPDGTIRFHGIITVHPNKTYTIDWGYGEVKMDIHRNFTLYNGLVIHQNGSVSAPGNVTLLLNGNVQLPDGTVKTRADVGTYGDVTINSDGTLLLPGDIEIPATETIIDDNGNTSRFLALPDAIKIRESDAEVIFGDDISIGKNGDIYCEIGGESLWGYMDDYTSVYLSNTGIEIYVGGDITNWSDYTITPDRQVDWLNERAALQPHEDIVVAHATGTSADIAGLPLSFNHMLSQVEVRVTNSNPHYQYVITSVKLARIKGDGTITLDPGAEWTLNPAKRIDYKPDIDFDKKYYEVNPDNGSHINKPFGLDEKVTTVCITDPNPHIPIQGVTTGSLYGSLMVLPQKLTPWNTTYADKTGAYIAVKLNVASPLGGIVYPPTDYRKTKLEYAWVAVPLSGEWKPGKRYVYTLDFTDGAGYSDPEKPNPHLVLDGKMKFSLTVTDWAEGGTANFPVNPPQPPGISETDPEPAAARRR